MSNTTVLDLSYQRMTYCETFPICEYQFFLSNCLISTNCLNLKKILSIWKRMVKNLVWYVVVIVVKTDATIHTKHNRNTYLPLTTNTTSLIVDKNGHNMYTSTCNMIWWYVKGMSMYIRGFVVHSFFSCVCADSEKLYMYLLCNMVKIS